MKKHYLLGYLFLVWTFIHSSAVLAQIKPIKLGETDFILSKSVQIWQDIDKSAAFKSKVSLANQSATANELIFAINSYKLNELTVNSKNAVVPYIDDATLILKSGAPELPKMAKSIVIPNQDEMSIEVTSASYIEVKNIDIAPSKGSLSRAVDPDDVPFVYGDEYKNDEFFPGKLAELSAPYIIRDVRGQTILTYPVQYNPVKKILRIYTEIKVKVASTGKVSTLNTLSSKSKDGSAAFKKIYKDHFLNYESGYSTFYNPLNDRPGNMLIICHGDFMDEMADFVAWKKQKGISVNMVDVSSIGGSSQIKTYVSEYYNNNGLTYLLLVGDDAQVPASSTSAGDSDNNYGYIVGSDHYIDVFVGRFSAQTAAQVSTMVERTIHYERDITTSENWMEKAIGSASSEGNSTTGDDGESDAQHMNNVETDLKNYGYSVTRVYESGGSVSQMSSAINSGTGLINYCGHGSITSWANVPFSTTYINALTNNNKLPFIMDVACLNGDFTSNTCFAETWLRATNNGTPTGAIGIYASTINQEWAPPMRAQDEFTDILIESYSNNIKRTFAGAAMNGIFDMIDHYGSTGNDMADTWTLFGDPSFVMRTKKPTTLSVSHASTVDQSASSFPITCSTIDALISLTVNGEIVGTKTVSSNTTNVSISSLPASGTMKITVTAYNTTVYSADVSISGGTVIKPVADFSGAPTTIAVGKSVQFSDKSTNYPTSWLWLFPGGEPSTSNLENPSVTYNNTGTYEVTLIVANSAGDDTVSKTAYITVEESPLTYCSSGGNNFSYEWISNVKIGSFINSSAGTSYSDFTNQTIELAVGESTSVNLTPGFKSTSYTEYWKIWIDYNKDGDFEDNNELVFSSTGTSEVSGSFTPANIPTTTRMRIAMKYNAEPTSCETFSYGETEDYTVTISSSSTIPPVADLSASAKTITAGESVTFTDNSSNSPTEWVWLFDGGTPSTSSAQNPTVTYNTEGNYKVTLTVANSAGVDTIIKTNYITVQPATLEYCASQGTTYTYEYIKTVSIGDFSKESSGSSYSDFTSTVINLSTGSNAISLTPEFPYNTYSEYWRIWIDYNKDGDFEDANELVFSPSESTSTVSGSFTPLSTFSGSTRMRISMKYETAPSPCETFSYGEVEDYTVSVTRNGDNLDRSITTTDELKENSFSIYPNPVNENLYITTKDFNAQLKIISSTGAVMESKTINGNFHAINVSAYPEGIYIIAITEQGKAFTDKFIKQ